MIESEEAYRMGKPTAQYTQRFYTTAGVAQISNFFIRSSLSGIMIVYQHIPCHLPIIRIKLYCLGGLELEWAHGEIIRVFLPISCL